MAANRKASPLSAILMSGLCLAIGLVVLLVFARNQDKLKKRCTESVNGIVTEVSSSEDADGNTSYSVELEYTVNGERYGYSGDSAHYVKKDESIQVFYDPEDPSVCYIPKIKTPPVFFKIFGGFFAVTGGLGLIGGISQIFQKKSIT